jgi:hypothetical protein
MLLPKRFFEYGSRTVSAGPSVCSSSTRIASPPSVRRTSAITAAARRWSRRSARVLRQASITSVEAGWSLPASGRAGDHLGLSIGAHDDRVGEEFTAFGELLLGEAEGWLEQYVEVVLRLR